MEKFMDSKRGGSVLVKIQTIQGLLEQQFVDVKFTPHPRPTFSFHDGVRKMSWLLVLNSEFLNDQSMSLDVLRGFIEEKVLKKVHANPGKRIQVSKYWDITVEEKNLP